LVTIKGTGDGLEFWTDHNASYKDIRSALMGRLGANAAFFTGSDKPVTFYGKNFTSPQKRELKTLLSDNFGLHRVVFVDDEPAPPAPPAEAAPEPIPAPSIFLCSTVRSGQRIESEGDITVVGDVNSGAELVAVGNICVFGRLSGIAHAGINGNRSACIVANKLVAPQVRIAGKVALLPPRKANGSEIVRIEGERIVVSGI